MECCRLALLVLATWGLLAVSSDECNTPTRVQSGEKHFLFAAFVKAENGSIIFEVNDSCGTWNVTVLLDGCFPTTIGSHELLLVQVSNILNNTVHFGMCVGDCVAACYKIIPHGTAAPNLTIGKTNVCKGNNSRPVCVKYNISNTQPCNDTLKPIRPLSAKPTSVSPSSATPPSSPTPPVATGKATMEFPKAAVVFMVVEVVELLMTCVLGVVLVAVIRRSRRKSFVTPASTTVRRVATDPMYISQNSLYEPFCGNMAAPRHDAQGS